MRPKGIIFFNFGRDLFWVRDTDNGFPMPIQRTIVDRLKYLPVHSRPPSRSWNVLRRHCQSPCGFLVALPIFPAKHPSGEPTSVDVPTPLTFHDSAGLAEAVLISMADHPTQRVQVGNDVRVLALKIISEMYLIKITHAVLGSSCEYEAFCVGEWSSSNQYSQEFADYCERAVSKVVG